MNLHGIVSAAIATVNPFVTATLKRSTGYTTAADGTRTPTYLDVPGVSVQVQALGYSDLQQLDGLNIQGVRRAVYLNGQALAVVRPLQTGGDLFLFPAGTLPEGDTWLVAYVLESWPDWCKCALTLQMDRPG
ncbi:hypothetical protein [Mesorhizobium sp. M7A.F.Ca.MR.148.00.0.0]|uniref:hypothetical protein n=1 Tax=Mesorhizobium sp. M7A.F.Ca.MR.148.00.0.0 TaxID=2496775 RepID=UPI000FC9E231|nr:hypothetical protein [Mesorhizobium sp. M7A.F.Ca.MR.148.00.0.0]RUV37415.1 hypothetical protein EOB49_11655 [Mesorhizobium sp. M7A.F.Ca.MR.148.00.0.0]